MASPTDSKGRALGRGPALHRALGHAPLPSRTQSHHGRLLCGPQCLCGDYHAGHRNKVHSLAAGQGRLSTDRGTPTPKCLQVREPPAATPCLGTSGQGPEQPTLQSQLSKQHQVNICGMTRGAERMWSSRHQSEPDRGFSGTAVTTPQVPRVLLANSGCPGHPGCKAAGSSHNHRARVNPRWPRRPLLPDWQFPWGRNSQQPGFLDDLSQVGALKALLTSCSQLKGPRPPLASPRLPSPPLASPQAEATLPSCPPVPSLTKAGAA